MAVPALARFKLDIFKALMHYLYQDVDHDIHEKLQGLITRNSSLLASSHRSFVYKNQLYVFDNKERIPRIKNRLHRKLYPEMEDLLVEKNTLEINEKPYVAAFLKQVLNASSSIQDYYALLPESLHRPLRELWPDNPEQHTHPTLPSETVEAIKTSNTEAVKLLNKRLMKNLLLRQ